MSLLTLAEVGARLGISRTSVWRLVRSGALPSVRITESLRRVDPADLERFVDERRERLVSASVVPLPQREES